VVLTAGRLLSVAAAVGLLAGFSAPPQAGVIRGRVVQPDVKIRTDARPSVSAIAAPARPPVDRRIAVVYLDAAPRQAFEPVPTTRTRMNQRGEEFVPRVLAVTVGTTVDFPNNDLTFHNVMSLAPGNSFDLGRYPRGQSRSVRFDTPGIVPIICDIHSHMSAYILVFSHPFFAVTETDGRYVLTGVPPGTHTLKVWSELGVAEPKGVTTGPGPVEADFVVVRPGR